MAQKVLRPENSSEQVVLILSLWFEHHFDAVTFFLLPPGLTIMYALDAGTGAVLWRYQGSFEYSTPSVSDGMVYIGSYLGHYINAIKAKTGALIWRYQTGGAVFAIPTVANGIVYVGSADGYLYALHASNGVLLWRHKTSGVVWSPTVG